MFKTRRGPLTYFTYRYRYVYKPSGSTIMIQVANLHRPNSDKTLNYSSLLLMIYDSFRLPKYFIKRQGYFKCTVPISSVAAPWHFGVDPDPSADPCLWLMDPDKDPDPAIFPSLTFCWLLFEGTFTSFFKDKKSKRSHKAVEIKVFLTIFAWW
jgi:hypothetical protein